MDGSLHFRNRVLIFQKYAIIQLPSQNMVIEVSTVRLAAMRILPEITQDAGCFRGLSLQRGHEERETQQYCPAQEGIYIIQQTEVLVCTISNCTISGRRIDYCNVL
jgi:hypothetical protein